MQQEEKDGKKKGCCRCSCCVAAGCVIVLICLFAWGISYHDFGENQDQSPMFSAKNGKNFSYDITYSWQHVEFDISETDFLGWCKNEASGWEPIEIEILPSLPTIDTIMPSINHRRECPLWIPRYCRYKPEHKNCNPWNKECQHDPTGKTDDACFRIVDNGYYYETRAHNGGGVYVLYDRDNNRCYIHGSAR